ncbi:MAG: histidinol-phosphate transaminase [Pseudomonadota bacterium]
MSDLSRRTFLGGAALGTAVAGSGLSLVTSSAAAASTAPSYGPAAGVAKLNANENPYGPSPNALKEMYEAAKLGAYYVGESVPTLKAMIAERHGITPEQISLSSGSSGVLTYLATAAGAEGNILGPDLFWDTTARMGTRHGGEVVRLPKNESLAIDLDAMYDAITDDISMVQITNPNNPTGSVLDGEELRAFCKKASRKATILVDEAYNELTEKPEYTSMVDLVREGYDVIIARTFSKIYGLAGMRVGYTIASLENTQKIRNFGLGDYAMNQAGVAAAVASYNDLAFLEMSKAKIIEAREMVEAGVKAAGLSALPSSTNFMFVDLGELNAETFRQKMAERNVLIRGIYRDYTNWSRVSMGRIEHVQMYVDALPSVLEEMGA